ncbi:MAG TPA: TauD/TfdA family dioxygenase [Thermoanaerobaculia bacterium]|jgi:alpha-ketoglutarate-dependent taurine dioxygenase|nr:TauD/TfdA family dioxygenase [Thermoanaerobaculia bacterium]
MPPTPTFAGRRQAIRADGSNLVTAERFTPDSRLLRIVKPNVDGLRLVDWAREHAALVESWLLDNGAVLWRGFAVPALEDFRQLLAAVAGELLEYRERSSPRHQVSDRIYTSTDYPPQRPILFHNENSYQRRWPLRIAFHCVTSPLQGGETPIADVRRVLARIPTALRERFEQHGVLYVRHFRGGLGHSWQQAFQTDDRAVVESYCREAGLDCEWHPGDRLTTRARRPAVATHPQTGEPVWFNHAAFFHSSSLDAATREALLAEVGEGELPNQTFYGDGTDIDPADVEILRQAYRQEAVTFPWRTGDVLLLDNMLTAHAREPFSGPRQILVGMARLYPNG